MMETRERTDLYPSRVGGQEAILPRNEPVVFETPAPVDVPLEPQQVESYAQHGFLHLPGFLSDEEVEAVHRESRRIQTSERLAGAQEIIHEPDSGQVRSIFRFHRFSSAMDRICRHPRLVRIARFLLGDDVYLHQTRINYKGGFRGKEFYWHSDFETWHVEDGMPRMRAVSCTVLLTENNEYNGPLMLMPGSHMHFISCAGQTPADHYKQSLRKQEVGIADPVALSFLAGRGGLQSMKGPAGSVVFFDCNTMHGSSSNISPYPRSNLFMVYNSVENRLAPPRGLKPRPEFIAAREDCEPIVPIESFLPPHAA
jgi:ectoine hydroxylase